MITFDPAIGMPVKVNVLFMRANGKHVGTIRWVTGGTTLVETIYLGPSLPKRETSWHTTIEGAKKALTVRYVAQRLEQAA